MGAWSLGFGVLAAIYGAYNLLHARRIAEKHLRMFNASQQGLELYAFFVRAIAAAVTLMGAFGIARGLSAL